MSPGDEPWPVAEHIDSPAGLHALSLDVSRRGVHHLVASSAALVLGSAQAMSTVDHAATVARGLDVVRRRSGGGGVLVIPGEGLWVDVTIGRDDGLWVDDVGRSMWWFGEAWVSALATIGVSSSVYRGELRRSSWSAAVCFAGWGSGEVIDDHGRKLVGISQRRTRDGARLQSMVHLQWRPDLVAELVAGEHRGSQDLLSDAVATAPIVDVAAFVGALTAALPPA